MSNYGFFYTTPPEGKDLIEAGSEADQLTPETPQPFVQADSTVDDITQQQISEFG